MTLFKFWSHSNLVEQGGQAHTAQLSRPPALLRASAPPRPSSFLLGSSSLPGGPQSSFRPLPRQQGLLDGAAPSWVCIRSSVHTQYAHGSRLNQLSARRSLKRIHTVVHPPPPSPPERRLFPLSRPVPVTHAFPAPPPARTHCPTSCLWGSDPLGTSRGGTAGLSPGAWLLSLAPSRTRT